MIEPHGRGDDSRSMRCAAASSETPPRAWGRPIPHSNSARGLRNTSTGVGKDVGSPLPLPSRRESSFFTLFFHILIGKRRVIDEAQKAPLGLYLVPRHEFKEVPVVFMRLFQGGYILLPQRRRDDDREMPALSQQHIHAQSGNASISVGKGVDANKILVEACRRNQRVQYLPFLYSAGQQRAHLAFDVFRP